MTLGGDGIISGTKLSDSHKENISKSQTLEGYINNYGLMEGTKLYNEKCLKLSLAQIERFKDPYEIKKVVHYGSDNGMFGKKHSDETLKKIVLKATGKKASEETKVKLSILNKGHNNPMFGNGKKISGNKNGKSKKWILLSPTCEKIILHGDVMEFCSKNNLDYDTLRRFKNKKVNCKIRNLKNEIEYKQRINTLGWTLFEFNFYITQFGDNLEYHVKT